MQIPIPSGLQLPANADQIPFSLTGKYIVIHGSLVALSLNGCDVNYADDDGDEDVDGEDMEHSDDCGCGCHEESESPEFEAGEREGAMEGPEDDDDEDEKMAQEDPTRGGPTPVAEKSGGSPMKGNSFMIAIETALKPKRK